MRVETVICTNTDGQKAKCGRFHETFPHILRFHSSLYRRPVNSWLHAEQQRAGQTAAPQTNRYEKRRLNRKNQKSSNQTRGHEVTMTATPIVSSATICSVLR